MSSKVKKKCSISITVFLLVVSMFSSLTFALESNDLTLTLDEAIESALNNNRSIKIENISFKQEELDIKETKRDLRKINMEMIERYTDDETIGNAEIYKNIGSLKADHSLEIAKDKRELVENQVKLQVKKSYYQVVELENMIKLAEGNLDYMEKQMEDVKLNMDLGNATNLDILSMEIQLESVRNQLKQLQGNKETAVMALNNAMGLSLHNEIIVEANLEELEFDFGLAESIEKALASRMDIKSAEKDQEFKKKELDIYKKYLLKNKQDRDSIESEYDIAVLNLENVKNSVIIDITSKYNNVINMKDQLNVAKLEVEKSEMEARVAQVRHDTEQITFTELVQAQNNLTNVKINLISAVHSYNNAVEEFIYAVEFGN